MSVQVVSSTGAPQGTVLSPFLFTLDTSDFQYQSESCYLQKCSDASAVMECISAGQETEYRELVDRFVAWCGNNNLILNVNKKKRMIVDFRRNKSNSISIMGEEVEMVKQYVQSVFTWTTDWTGDATLMLFIRSRHCFLRKLRSYSICSKMLHIFYKSVVESSILSAVICWGSSIRASDLKKLNKLIKWAGSVLGAVLEPLDLTFEEVYFIK